MSNMSKSVRISEEFHAFIKAHTRDDETLEETIRRLIGGPHPEDVAGILSTDTAETMRARLEEKGGVDREEEQAVSEKFE